MPALYGTRVSTSSDFLEILYSPGLQGLARGCSIQAPSLAPELFSLFLSLSSCFVPRGWSLRPQEVGTFLKVHDFGEPV